MKSVKYEIEVLVLHKIRIHDKISYQVWRKVHSQVLDKVRRRLLNHELS